MRLIERVMSAGLRPIKKVSVSEWADSYRQLPSTAAESGKWRTGRVPYLKEIMDAFTEQGIHRVVAMTSAQVGKALDVETPIPTPGGWTTMAELRAGDKVFDDRGEVCTVTFATEIMYNRPCYEIVFSDGEKIVADAAHKWAVEKRHTKKIMTTAQLYHDSNWYIVTAFPLTLPEMAGDINFYAIGKAAGDGADIDIKKYLRASVSQRLQLQSGLMTSRSFNDNESVFEFPLDRAELAKDTAELLKTLHKVAIMKLSGDTLRINFFPQWSRRIVAVTRVTSRPVKCISVDSPSHLYLAGRGMIPTHNTECLLNVLGRYVQLDPCNIMLIQPTLEMAADISKDRLTKMIQDTKSLTPLFYGEEKVAKTRSSTQTILSKAFQGGRLVLAGANSAAGLASRPIRLLLCDEVDRFPESAGNNEGDPVNLAAKRCTTYWNYVIGLFSTPTTEGASRIETEYLQGTQEEWQHACPNCGEYHKLDYRNFFVDGAVKWRCPDCGMNFTEREMKATVQKYIAQKPEAAANGIRSFWVNAFSSPWISWSAIMAEWAEAKGTASREKVIVNTRFAETYAEVGEFADENVFLKRLEEYNAEVPEGVRVLTAAVDVQANRLEYEIAGWGVGESRFGILRGIVWGKPNEAATWAKLDAVLEREYFFADGNSLKVTRTFIDSGFATKVVYSYCYENRYKQRFAIKGQGGAGLALLHKYTRIKSPPLTLTVLGVDDGKQEIFSRLAEEGDRAMHFPKDDIYLGQRGYDEIYFKQLISEKRGLKWTGGVAKLAWQPIHKHVRNESLDLAVYNYACFLSLNMKLTERTAKPQPKVTQTKVVKKQKSYSAEIF